MIQNLMAEGKLFFMNQKWFPTYLALLSGLFHDNPDP